MKYYKIDPEVAGGWGPNTVISTLSGGEKVVTRLQYVFDGWLGDEIVEGSQCFVVTESLAITLESLSLSGFTLKGVEVMTSDLYRELYPDRPLPRCLWLSVGRRPGRDDLGLDADGRLVVSEKALAALRSHRLQHCDIMQVPEGIDLGN